MKGLLVFLLILVIIGGGMKLAGMQLPILDYKLGGLGWGPQQVDLRPGSLRGDGGQISIPLH